MKKSNKISFLYILSSVVLFLMLVGGGCYGIYLSVGLSFVRNGISNITDAGAMNVSFGGSVNFSYSMVGVIILSIGLIILSIFDLISLCKQLVLFKQFKLLKNSTLEKNIEKKVTSKTKIIFVAILLDVISFIVGILGIILNSKTFPSGSMCWPLYVIEGLISILSVVSIVLLIIKLRGIKKDKPEENLKENQEENQNEIIEENQEEDLDKNNDYDIDEMEYRLFKLKQLKYSRIISNEEYNSLRNSILNLNVTDSSDKEKNTSD